MVQERRLIKLKPAVHQQLLDIANKRDVTIGDVVEYLLRKWGELSAFDDIPCSVCTKPIPNFTRDQVLKVFKSWHHGDCVEVGE
jgi:hypothetical protein